MERTVAVHPADGRGAEKMSEVYRGPGQTGGKSLRVGCHGCSNSCTVS